MKTRTIQICAICLAVGSIGLATFVAGQKARTRKASGQASTRRAASTRNRVRSTAAGLTTPVRRPDPNRAPRTVVDEALYTNEEFFGATTSIARPYSDALTRLTPVIEKYPRDPQLRLRAAALAESLSQYDRAAAEMASYADLKKRSADALRRLADFYHYRARFADEVRTLQELATALRVDERGPIYRRAAKIVRAYQLKEFNPANFFSELIAADPSNIQPVKDYVSELLLQRNTQRALAVLNEYQTKFPSDLAYFLKTRSRISLSAGDRKAAEQVYSSAFEPTWPRAVLADYYALLRGIGRYRIVRRGLQERVRAGATDLDTVARLFSVFSHEGSYEQAARVLQGLEERRSKTGAGQRPVDSTFWTEKELQTAAAMFASIGYYDQASRYLYTLYLTGGLKPGSDSREESLYLLFKAMLDAAGTPTRVGAGDLSFYRDVAQLDQHPGLLNGVLSLILSGNDIPQEFATEEKAAAGYFNREFAYRIFNAVKAEYPQSRHLGEMYLGVVSVFSSLGEYKLAIEAGREFLQQFPDSPSYSEVSLRIADSYVALKDRQSERKVLAELLNRLASAQKPGIPLVPVSSRRWHFGSSPLMNAFIDKIRYKIEAYNDTYDPTEDKSSETQPEQQENDEDVGETEQAPEHSDESEPDEDSTQASGPATYNSVLERYVSSLAVDEKKTETVALFWGEIKKHPKEEGLYERFLQWLGQAQLINEQLKAYNAAVGEFDSNTWYHRLARWYVRQKRGRELTNFGRKLIDVFDEDEIADYLLRFGGYGAKAAADNVDWDERFAFELYSYAHTRFPRNLLFVRGMLTYLARNDRPKWERLSAEYYFADRSIRDDYLQWLSKQNTLRQRYTEAKQRRGEQLATTAPSFDRSFGYAVFAADAALWLSHHDEALGAYRQLSAMYPGNDQYSERLAELTRSFGQTSDKLFEESAGIYSQLADLYPLNHDYRIKAGEVYAQLGDFQRAATEWDKMIKLEPGERKTYLEVATVFWDYYQYDDAIRVFKELRRVTGDSAIYAYRMGAVYEGKGDLDSAIAEYVKVLPEPGDGRDTVVKRLAQLSRRAGVAEKIASAYEKARRDAPDDWQLVIGYATYQAERDHQADALAMLRTEVARTSNVSFLETARDLFREILRPEDEQQVVTRLVEVARDEREAMMYRLQLAALLERRNQVDAAIAVVDKLTSDFPTNVGVIQEASQFYWRAGLLDKSLDLYKRTIARAVGANRRSFTLQLARMQTEANKLSDAEATLRPVYEADRSDVEAFSALAKVLGAENKLQELSALYQDAFKEARQAGLGGDESRARIVQLRAGMIKTLDSLGKFDAAVGQHIEIINTYPEDSDRLLSALEYADQHGLADRILKYYEKLSKESYKNFRWQLVLGRIYERQGNLTAATEQYKTAVLNEPQRPDLRFNLASVLTRQRKFDDAIAVLREGWTLAGRDPQWLIEIAQIQVRQAQPDEAAKTMRQALASKQNASSQARFVIAAKLASWGIDAEAVRVYEETFKNLPKTLKNEYVGNAQVSGYVRALVATKPAAEVFQEIERLRGVFLAIGQNSQDSDGYKAKNIVSAIDQSMRDDFGLGVLEHATGAESSALVAAIQSPVQKLNSYSDAEAMRRYLGIARGAGLVELEEQIQLRLKDTAYDARPKNSPTVTQQDNQYYNELRAVTQFYERHARFSLAAETLIAEQKRDPYKNRFDYDTKVADEYRLAGDTQREIEALRRAYAGSTGDLMTGQIEWVERYLNLLYTTGARGELQRLASLYNPHQLQLITFLIDKKEQLLALDAIERAHQSPAWVASRSAEVGLFLQDRSPEVEPLFRTALGMKPIGQMLGRKSPNGKELVGDDWFVASRNFGYWLGFVGREGDSRKFIAGEIEGHPSSARAQIELASYYLEHKNSARAGEHTLLAAELQPQSIDIKILRGRIALANRDRKAALEAFQSILDNTAAPATAQTYLKVMSDNGFLAEAVTPLDRFITGFINRVYRNRGQASDLESIKPLIRDLAERSRKDSRVAAQVATMFHEMVSNIPADNVIPRMLIDEELLPETELGPIYRAVHQRFSDTASAMFGTPQYDSGYYNGRQWVYPSKELAEWRKRFIDFLIRQRSFDEAKLLIATIKREQSDLHLSSPRQGEDDYSNVDSDYEWLPLAVAVIELRSGNVANGIGGLRRYCGLENKQGADQGSSDEHDRSRCSNAYALLVAEHHETEADALLYESYRKTIRSRNADDASFTGLAELEARQGKTEESIRLLRLMTERSTNNLTALLSAAETAARINLLAEAIRFREQLAESNPKAATNRLELARLMAVAGRGPDALERLATLIDDRSAGNTIRAQAAEVAGEIVERDRSLAARAAELLGSRTSDAGIIALAAVRNATGDREQAKELLNRIRGGPLEAVSRLKLGMISLAERRDADAITSFERALQIDADGRMTDSIRFAGAGPRAQLIVLYGRIGRDAAVISLAEGDDSQRASFVSSIVKSALERRSDEQRNREFSFEPSMEHLARTSPGPRTLSELNQLAAVKIRNDILASIVESAVKWNQYDRAIAIERFRLAEAAVAEEKKALEKRMQEIASADQARRVRLAAQVRFDKSGATQSIYAARVAGD